MDTNDLSEDYVEESAQQSIKDTLDVIDYINNMPRRSPENPVPLVQPILTPRFALSCTNELLDGVGQIYKRLFIHLQTHISENQTEIETTIDVFKHLPPHNLRDEGVAPHHPVSHTYTSIYDHFGLLGDKTILAHGVHLIQGELELIKARNTGLSHCAGSNFNLRSGVASVGRWLDMGIKVQCSFRKLFLRFELM